MSTAFFQKRHADSNSSVTQRAREAGAHPMGDAALPLPLPTPGQYRLAIWASLAMVLGTAVLLPFADRPIGAVPGFFAMYQAVVVVSCLITAYLMYGHFKATRAKALLHLGAGYLYTACVLAMQVLSYPGVLVENGRLFGGSQTTVWLWFFWHFGLAATVLQVQLAEVRQANGIAQSPAHALRKTALGLGAALGATALLVFGFADRLPVLDVQGDYSRITRSGLAPALQVMLAVALVVVWRTSRFRSALHVWLAVVLVALLCDNALTMATANRQALGWYAGRLGALVGFSVLMLAYLHEIKNSYLRSVEVADQLAFSNSQLDEQLQLHTSQAQELLQADVRKDEFLAMLAHELRNPLAPMSTAAHLLSVGYADANLVKKTSEMLTRQVRQMSGLVEDLLDVSRLSRGIVGLKAIQVDTRQVLADSVEQATPLIAEKKHRLRIQAPAEPLFVIGDPGRLVQVITNLLNNAAKYTPPGGNIGLRLEQRESQVVFTVADDGIGMEPELLQRAFLLFTQGESTPERSRGGLGIGLALVKSLVELHGGRVHAASAGPGRGSKFSVMLPPARELTSPVAAPIVVAWPP